MSTAIIAKYAWRIPELLARAAVGDVTAIALLAAMGIAAAAVCIKNNK